MAAGGPSTYTGQDETQPGSSLPTSPSFFTMLRCLGKRKASCDSPLIHQQAFIKCLLCTQNIAKTYEYLSSFIQAMTRQQVLSVSENFHPEMPMANGRCSTVAVLSSRPKAFEEEMSK